MALSVLLIGYGAIARYVADAVVDDPEIDITAVLAKPGREDAARAAIGSARSVISDLDGLGEAPDVALECAGHEAVAVHGPRTLERGIPLGIVSVGTLADDSVAEALDAAAARGGTALEILSGAIGAIDALASAREGGLDRVVYTSRKPPLSWRGTPAEDVCDLATLDSAVDFYKGTAREAARLYPKNANVAATVALAGLGLDKTQVTLIADPAAEGNTHRVEADGAFGRFDLTMVGRPLPDNPRSSALTAMSAVRFLRNKARHVRV